MKEHIIREYQGTGDLVFSSSEKFKCNFTAECHKNGKLKVICNVHASNEFFQILKRESDRDKPRLLEASLTGKTTDDGIITISKLLLSTITFNSKSGLITKSDDQKISFTNTDILSTGIFTFNSLSEINITYKKVDPNGIVKLRFGIFNFEFIGSESSNPNLPKLDKLNISVDDFKLNFLQDSDY